MKVNVLFPGSTIDVEAELAYESYVKLANQLRRETISTLLIAYVEEYGNEYINRELGDTNDDLTDGELATVTTSVMATLFADDGSVIAEEDIKKVARALKDHSLQDDIGAAVKEVVDNRYKTYRVNITCTSIREVYVRARCANDIEEAIENCWDLNSFMEDGDLVVDEVSIENAFGHLAEMDIDDI